MDPYFFQRLRRRPWLSLCTLVLSGLLCFLLCFLSGYREAQEQKLAETRETFDILCVVTDRRGTQSAGLRMSSNTAWFVTDPESPLSGLIRDVRITKEYMVTSFGLNLSKVPMTGVTNERCAEDLDPAMGGRITWLEDGFFDREDYVCLVSEEIYASLEDETVNFSVVDPFVYPDKSTEEGFGQAEFRVVGYYAGSGSSVYIPYPASQALAVELSNRGSSDSISFLAADNTRLEALSEAASELFGAVDPTASEHSMPRYALTIHDEQYRATVAALEQNIARTQYLLPLAAALALGLGFLISFLATRGENRTYALMRTLGLTRGKLFWSILREQLVLVVLAAAAVLAITRQAVPAAVYLLCYSVGCVLCTGRTIQIPPTAILREQE